MKRTTVFLTEPEIDQLKKLSKERDLSVPDLIRRAIDEYLKREERTMKKLVIAFMALAMMAMAVPAMALDISDTIYNVTCQTSPKHVFKMVQVGYIPGGIIAFTPVAHEEVGICLNVPIVLIPVISKGGY